jgi:hypothetical protein
MGGGKRWRGDAIYAPERRGWQMRMPSLAIIVLRHRLFGARRRTYSIFTKIQFPTKTDFLRNSHFLQIQAHTGHAGFALIDLYAHPQGK